jgi:hypothetical protein
LVGSLVEKQTRTRCWRGRAVAVKDLLVSIETRGFAGEPTVRGSIAILACLLAVLTGGAASADVLGTDVTQLNPIREATLSIPRGWAVCDELSGRKSGNTVGTVYLDQMRCNPSSETDVGTRHILASTNHEHPALVLVLTAPEPVLRVNSFANLTPEDFSGLDQMLCEKASDWLLVAMESCSVSMDRLAGEAAMLGNFTARIKSNNAEVTGRIVNLSYSGGMLMVFTRVSAHQVPDPAIDAIINSIVVR